MRDVAITERQDRIGMNFQHDLPGARRFGTANPREIQLG
jgi:hypothetical protein